MPGIKYTVVLQPEELGYSVTCPAVPGAVSQGDSMDEALRNIQDAVQGILAGLKEDGRKVPQEKPDPVAAEVRVILKERAEDGLPLTIETREIEVEAGVLV